MLKEIRSPVKLGPWFFSIIMSVYRVQVTLGMNFPHIRKYTPNQRLQCKYSNVNRTDKMTLFESQFQLWRWPELYNVG